MPKNVYIPFDDTNSSAEGIAFREKAWNNRLRHKKDVLTSENHGVASVRITIGNRVFEKVHPGQYGLHSEALLLAEVLNEIIDQNKNGEFLLSTALNQVLPKEKIDLSFNSPFRKEKDLDKKNRALWTELLKYKDFLNQPDVSGIIYTEREPCNNGMGRSNDGDKEGCEQALNAILSAQQHVVYFSFERKVENWRMTIELARTLVRRANIGEQDKKENLQEIRNIEIAAESKQTVGYEALLEPAPEKLAERKIYIQLQENSLQYTVLGLDGNKKTGFINERYLPSLGGREINSLDAETIKSLLLDILKSTAHNKHTAQIPGITVDFIKDELQKNTSIDNILEFTDDGSKIKKGVDVKYKNDTKSGVNQRRPAAVTSSTTSTVNAGLSNQLSELDVSGQKKQPQKDTSSVPSTAISSSSQVVQPIQQPIQDAATQKKKPSYADAIRGTASSTPAVWVVSTTSAGSHQPTQTSPSISGSNSPGGLFVAKKTHNEKTPSLRALASSTSILQKKEGETSLQKQENEVTSKESTKSKFGKNK